MELKTILDDSATQTVWLPFQGGEVEIAYISPDRADAIRAGLKAANADVDAMARRFADESVRGWRGFTLNGADLPYTPETSYKLMLRWDAYREFAKRMSRDGGALLAAFTEGILKNSNPTSGQD